MADKRLTADDLYTVVRVRAMCASGEAGRIRHEARLTQSEVAEAAGVPPHRISEWERGAMPAADVALRYGEVLAKVREAMAEGETP